MVNSRSMSSSPGQGFTSPVSPVTCASSTMQASFRCGRRASGGFTLSSTSSKVVIERTYRASVDELWELWTTKEGFESWWPPEGSRAEVHAIEACLNGKLQYDMIAETPEMVAVMKELGLPASHVERARFSEFRPVERLVLAIMMDFLPGVARSEEHTSELQSQSN